MKKWLLAGVLLLCGCRMDSQPAPVTFHPKNCVSTPSEETRQRKVNTSCALRSGGNLYNHAKPCIMWHHKTITERKHTLVCQRSEWREDK